MIRARRVFGLMPSAACAVRHRPRTRTIARMAPFMVRQRLFSSGSGTRQAVNRRRAPYDEVLDADIMPSSSQTRPSRIFPVQGTPARQCLCRDKGNGECPPSCRGPRPVDPSFDNLAAEWRSLSTPPIPSLPRRYGPRTWATARPAGLRGGDEVLPARRDLLHQALDSQLRLIQLSR